MLNKDKFIELLSGLGELYDKQITEAMFDIYYEALKDFSFEQISGAAMKCVKTHKYNTLPKPAEILEWLEGSIEDKAYIAWTQAHMAVVKYGHYDTVEFADPIISNVIQELGGWMLFSDIKTTELPFWEKRFREFYKVFEKRGVNTPVKLMGFIELSNTQTNYLDCIPEPIKIGFNEYLIKYEGVLHESN